MNKVVVLSLEGKFCSQLINQHLVLLIDQQQNLLLHFVFLDDEGGESLHQTGPQVDSVENAD